MTPMPWDKQPDKGLATPDHPAPAATSIPANAVGGFMLNLPSNEVSALVDSLATKAQAALAYRAEPEAQKWAQAAVAALAVGADNLPALPDLTHGTVTLPDGESFALADAKSRALRTLAQGLAIDSVAALVGISGDLAHIDLLHQAGWITFGALVGKTVLQTAISYLSRIKFTPSYQQQQLGLKS